MTLSSSFCVPPKQTKCHGVLLTGNYGFGHRILAIPLKQSTKMPVSPVSLFPKGFAGSFTKAIVGMGCSFKHSCFKCRVKHPAHSCTFRPPTQLPIHGLWVPVPIFVPPIQPLLRQPGLALPTPVKFERLLPSLCGYDAQVVSFLFLYIFPVCVFLFVPKIWHQLIKTQR